MSWIDLIFCTNKNIISNHEADVTIFEKCHHNTIYDKTDIRIPLPPLYIHEVWDYSKANIENIKKAIPNFNCTRASENISVDKKVELLNETLLKICWNYIPNKKIKCDYPPLMTLKNTWKKDLNWQKYFTKTVKEWKWKTSFFVHC